MENNANNSENASKREFRPIFNATITPQSIETLQTSKGDNYLKMTGATVAFKDKSQERTAMAFGKSFADVEALLQTGKPVALAVQFAGGSVTIVDQFSEPVDTENPARRCVWNAGLSSSRTSGTPDT